ncbi:MAG: class I adenylate-forming enzyme family protein [Bacteroidota bacterium]
MTNEFFRDDQIDCQFSYAQLLKTLNNQPSYYTTNYAQYLPDFYINLILACLHDDHITILDSSSTIYSIGERINLLSLKDADVAPIRDVDELIDRLRQSEASISLFTSGTTGKPKKVTHSVKKILAMTRTGARYRSNRWLLAYHPAHMAGLQVFFQALLNANLLVNCFAYPVPAVFAQLRKYQISHLSATPTFYRLLLANGAVYERLKRLTIGGERSDLALHERLSLHFPGSKINNIYSTTESGTLLVSNGIYFSIPTALQSRIRVVEEELQVHCSLLGDSNDIEGEWYATGDQVKWIDKTRFTITNRQQDIVNVAGNKVCLIEIEQQLEKLEGIKNCRVFTRKNTLVGHLICCELVLRNPSLKAIHFKRQLEQRLPAYKVPRIIKIVDRITVGDRGKVKRYEESTAERLVPRFGT